VLRLYVDGRPVGGTLDTPLRIDYASTTQNAAFGRYVGHCSLPFGGDLDLVRLWSGAGSASWAASEAARALRPGTDPPPVGQQPPLPAALPPEVLAAAPPATGTGGGRPADAPGAPPRACTVALSRRRIAAGRGSTVRARVTLRGRPARAVRVVAKRRGKPITAARTNARGRARLKLRVRRPGRVRVSAATRPRCAPAYIRVAR
jgi:hypothetical protein